MTDIYLGRIVKAFGIKGELKFHPSDDFWESTLESKQLMLHTHDDDDGVSRPVVFQRSRPHGNNYVVRVDGVDDRNGAEALVGSDVFIRDDELDVDPPEKLLPYQLIGMTAKDEGGVVLGRISSVVYSSAHDIYEISHDGGSFLVPAVPEFIVSIDQDAGTIVVRPMPGLIED